MKAWVMGWLWIFFPFISGVQTAAKSEITRIRTEGENFTESCPTSTWKYSNSKKAWQRLDQGEPLNLVITKRPEGKTTQAQVGRYYLEDFPAAGILLVRITNLQVEDSGLYRCVIYQPPKEPEALHFPIRLVVTNNHSALLVSEETSILPPTTIKIQSNPQTTSRTVTQISLKSTPSVNHTNGTVVIRIPMVSIILLVVCGFLSKSIVFTVLLVVTQRSFGN